MFPPERLQPLLQENPACDLRQRKPSAPDHACGVHHRTPAIQNQSDRRASIATQRKKCRPPT